MLHTRYYDLDKSLTSINLNTRKAILCNYKDDSVMNKLQMSYHEISEAKIFTSDFNDWSQLYYKMAFIRCLEE